MGEEAPWDDPAVPPLPLPSPPLTNGGVSLRAWLVEDAPALEAACADPDIPRFTTVPATYSASAAQEWVARQDDNRESGESIVLAITERGEECPLGTVVLGRLLDSAGGAELGYWLMPEARGRGLAARAARLLVDWGFAELCLRRLELATRPENRASQRVAVRLGFRREGLRRQHREYAGERLDMIVYSLLAPEEKKRER